jgi:hypothetical protein
MVEVMEAVVMKVVKISLSTGEWRLAPERTFEAIAEDFISMTTGRRWTLFESPCAEIGWDERSMPPGHQLLASTPGSKRG